MKEEALKKFREEYTTYLEAADSEFKEIDELEKELEKDPRVIQLKKLQEEINNDPKTKKLEKLKMIKKDYEQQQQEYGHWNYTNSYYAYIKTRPSVEDGDTYGVLLRYGPRDASSLGRKAQVNGMIYTYLDIENFQLFDIREEESKTFEKGHIIIPVLRDANEERIRKEFFLGCIDKEPEEVAKELIKKYSPINMDDE